MNQLNIDGILVTWPTEADIRLLKVGDFAPDVFGRMREVTSIYARGKNVHGKWYVCFYTDISENANISGSMTADEAVATLPAGSRWKRTENYPRVHCCGSCGESFLEEDGRIEEDGFFYCGDCLEEGMILQQDGLGHEEGGY